MSFNQEGHAPNPPSWPSIRRAKVPTLLIDGRVLTEWQASCSIWPKSFPAAGLLPDGDVEAEARVVSWMFVHRLLDPSGAPPGAGACARGLRAGRQAAGQE